MFNDAIDLWEFYGTSLGKTARRAIRQKIRRVWPDVSGLQVLGLGYSTPYMRPFLDEADRVLAIMPAQQGVIHWPFAGANLTALADEAGLPLEDTAVDRVLMVHAVECTEQLRAMLTEAWRVLAGNGRILVVVPNRRSLWARVERTPFGHGHPYSASQLSRLLRDTMFTPSRTEHALFIPPYPSRLLLRSASTVEEIGERWFPGLSGVVMIEATKQVFARPKPKPFRLRAPKLIPVPARRPAAAMTRQDVQDA